MILRCPGWDKALSVPTVLSAAPGSVDIGQCQYKSTCDGRQWKCPTSVIGSPVDGAARDLGARMPPIVVVDLRNVEGLGSRRSAGEGPGAVLGAASRHYIDDRQASC
ncbi:hypothetical protein Pen02_54930 [Plantactinospora endophytica]|uniref:Uncharacterized protein n=1 Tax=Plantactinospora endophytica TaxID=673535 RepID=A0ABQ4E8E8_9ACTN|nr:hypothetical protein Pen02_54930 [Plantactinospora endophytica]